MTGLEVGSESLDTAQQALESVNQENSETSTQTPRLLSVPLELIRQILGNLSYDDIKRVRQVNKQLSAVTGYLVFAQIPLKIKEDALKEFAKKIEKSYIRDSIQSLTASNYKWDNNCEFYPVERYPKDICPSDGSLVELCTQEDLKHRAKAKKIEGFCPKLVVVTRRVPNFAGPQQLAAILSKVPNLAEMIVESTKSLSFYSLREKAPDDCRFAFFFILHAAALAGSNVKLKTLKFNNLQERGNEQHRWIFLSANYTVFLSRALTHIRTFEFDTSPWMLWETSKGYSLIPELKWILKAMPLLEDVRLQAGRFNLSALEDVHWPYLRKLDVRLVEYDPRWFIAFLQRHKSSLKTITLEDTVATSLSKVYPVDFPIAKTVTKDSDRASVHYFTKFMTDIRDASELERFLVLDHLSWREQSFRAGCREAFLSEDRTYCRDEQYGFEPEDCLVHVSMNLQRKKRSQRTSEIDEFVTRKRELLSEDIFKYV